MGKPPRAPYAPDPPPEAAPVREPGDLVDAIVEDMDWANRRCLRLAARRAALRRCRLTGADLAEAVLGDVAFSDCRLDLVNLRYARLERVVFSDCRMSECDLTAAQLTDVLFERCELREATFSGATVKRVELRGCDLGGSRGIEALRTARMPWGDVLANAPSFASALGIEILE